MVKGRSSSIVLLACLCVAAADDPADRRKCKGPFHHHEPLHVYNIQAKHASKGIANKSCGDTDGELAYIFGGIKEFSKPDGVAKYYNGTIQMVHVSVSSWGDFLECDHKSGSTKYYCKCPKDHKGKKGCDMRRPGRKVISHNKVNYTMYSFPSKGEGKHWSVESGNKTRGCMEIRVTAKCVIDALAKAAGCKPCTMKDASTCATCINKLNATKTKQVWDAAIWNGSCPLVNSSSDLDATDGYAIVV